MSQDFLPAILNATDQVKHHSFVYYSHISSTIHLFDAYITYKYQMAMYLGKHMDEPLEKEFTHYCIFEVWYTVSKIFILS